MCTEVITSDDISADGLHATEMDEKGRSHRCCCLPSTLRAGVNLVTVLINTWTRRTLWDTCVRIAESMSASSDIKYTILFPVSSYLRHQIRSNKNSVQKRF